MMKKITILTLLFTAFICGAHAQSVKKHETLSMKQDAKYFKQIKGPDNEKITKFLAKQGGIAKLPGIEEIDEWNILDSKWDTVQRVDHQYNSKGLLIRSTLTDMFTGPALLFEYLHDENDNVIELTMKTYHKEKLLFINWFRYKYSYDEKDRLTSKLDQRWDTTSSEWLNGQHERTDYDTQGNMTYYILSSYNNGVWQGLEGIQRDYVYDDEGRKISTMNIHMNVAQSRWDTVDLMLHSYAEFGTLKENIYQLYNKGEWQNSMKETFIFLAPPSETVREVITCSYNKTLSKWDSLEKMANIDWFYWTNVFETSDPAEYIIQEMGENGFENRFSYYAEKPNSYWTRIELWNEFNGAEFVPITKTTSIINRLRVPIEYKVEHYVDGSYYIYSWNKTDIVYDNDSETMLESTHSEWDIFNEELVNIVRYRYSGFDATGIDNLKYNSTTMNIYPNPSKDKSNISVDVIAETNVLIEVYNLTGQKIITVLNDEKLGTGKHQFSFSVPAGIYIVRTRMNNEIYTAKAIVE